jgi:hypothetical protein
MLGVCLLITSCTLTDSLDELSKGPANPNQNQAGTSGTNGEGGSSVAGNGGQSGAGQAGAGQAGATAGSAGQGGSAGAGMAGTTAAGMAGSGGNTVDYQSLKINELAPSGVPDDWIELKNLGTVPISLAGVIVAQKYDGTTIPAGADRYTFGDVTIDPGGYVLIAKTKDFVFGLGKDSPERVSLFSPNGDLLDDTTYEASIADPFTSTQSWARLPDGTGMFARSNQATPEASNLP